MAMYRKALSSTVLRPEQRTLIRIGYRWFNWENARSHVKWARGDLLSGQWWAMAHHLAHALKSMAYGLRLPA